MFSIDISIHTKYHFSNQIFVLHACINVYFASHLSEVTTYPEPFLLFLLFCHYIVQCSYHFLMIALRILSYTVVFPFELGIFNNWECFAKHDKLGLSDISLELFLIQIVLTTSGLHMTTLSSHGHHEASMFTLFLTIWLSLTL